MLVVEVEVEVEVEVVVPPLVLVGPPHEHPIRTARGITPIVLRMGASYATRQEAFPRRYGAVGAGRSRASPRLERVSLSVSSSGVGSSLSRSGGSMWMCALRS